MQDHLKKGRVGRLFKPLQDYREPLAIILKNFNIIDEHIVLKFNLNRIFMKKNYIITLLTILCLSGLSFMQAAEKSQHTSSSFAFSDREALDLFMNALGGCMAGLSGRVEAPSSFLLNTNILDLTVRPTALAIYAIRFYPDLDDPFSKKLIRDTKDGVKKGLTNLLAFDVARRMCSSMRAQQQQQP